MKISQKKSTRFAFLTLLVIPISGLLLMASRPPTASSPIYPVPATSLTAFFSGPASLPTPTPLSAGSAAPPFALVGLDGKQYSLQDFRGKRVLLNFWATWCPPCREEMPLLQATYTRLASKGVVVIGVNAGEDVRAVRQYVQELNLTFPILLETTQWKAVEGYQVPGLPTTYFIDSKGRLIDQNVGPLTEAKLQSYLDKLAAADRQG